MLTASRSIGRAVDSGRPLPEVPALDVLYRGAFKCRPRYGQVTLVAGQPKSMKSMFVLWWISQLGVPSLYMSADMAEHTAITRLAAAMTGDTTKEVMEGLDGAGEAFYAEALDRSKVKFSYNPNPTLEDIDEEISAWVEWSDTYPHVIVLDNLMDVLTADDSDLRAQKAVLLEAKTWARHTGAAIFVLHHMTEAIGSPTEPSPRKAIQNKVAHTPETVLSVAVDGDEFKISVVAARNGRQDPSGREYVSLKAVPERNRFEPWPRVPSIPVPAYRPWEKDDD
jgi:hypothetical protein